jgi:spermidine synthase
MRQWGVRASWLTEGAVAEVARPDHAVSLLAALRQVRPVSLNTDMQPAAYYQALLVWAEAFQVSGTKLLQWAVRLNLWDAILFVAVATGILALAAAFAERPIRVALPATRVYVGIAGIVLEMVLIFAFQSIYGYVYSRLGILFAAFMMGTAFGAILSAWKLAPRAEVGALAVCQTALTVLAAAFVPILSGLAASGGWPGPAGATVLLPLLSFCVGALVGVQYPVSVALGEMHRGDETRPGAVAAGLYALELAGACAGALLAGTVLIPVLGIPGVCWAVSALSLAGLPLLLL